MESSLKIYSRQGCDEGGLRDSGGSWYFRMMSPDEVDTVLAAAARRPEGRKFGFCFSGPGEGLSLLVDLNASTCDGSGPLDRW